jgi:uncharacterized MnhB-related membrane protein
MATIFILSVFAYFVLKYDVHVIEKLVLLALIATAALLPLTWPQARVACAVAQGFFGVYIVLRMHYLRAAEQRGIVWK